MCRGILNIYLAARSPEQPCLLARKPGRESDIPIDHFDVSIGIQQLGDSVLRRFAIAALVIKELDHRHIAIRIATDRRSRVGKELLVITRYSCLIFGGYFSLLPAVHFLGSFHDQLRLLYEETSDDVLDCGFLRLTENCRVRGWRHRDLLITGGGVRRQG